MNDKEKKAIRNLENLSEFGLSATLNQADLDKMKTILNLIENQKEEIEEKDKSLKLHTKLEYQYKNDYLNVIEDLKKKDKIIDLAINKVDHIDKCMICTNENCHECNSCMKEYFENKAEEEK